MASLLRKMENWSFGFGPSSQYFSILSFKVIVTFVAFLTVINSATAIEKGFTSEFVDADSHILRLSCHVGKPSKDNNVLSIAIFQATSRKNLAVIYQHGHPQTEDTTNNIFVAGGTAGEMNFPTHLQALLFQYDSSVDHMFGCNVSRVVRVSVEYDVTMITVNKIVMANRNPVIPASASNHQTDASYAHTEEKHLKHNETTDSRAVSTTSSTTLDGLPTMIVVTLLVLVSLLVVLALALVIVRSKARCKKEDSIYRPPTYCMPYEPRFEFEWQDMSYAPRQEGHGKSVDTKTQPSNGDYSIHPQKPLPPIPGGL